VISVTRFDSGSQQLSSVSYSYDPHGRQSSVTDARNGATTYGYNAADLVTSVLRLCQRNGGARHHLELRPVSRLARQQTVRRRPGTQLHQHPRQAAPEPDLGTHGERPTAGHELRLRQRRRCERHQLFGFHTRHYLHLRPARAPGHGRPEWRDGDIRLQHRQRTVERVVFRRHAGRPLRHQRLRPVSPPRHAGRPALQYFNTPSATTPPPASKP